MDYLESLLDDSLKTSAHAGAEPLGEAASQPTSTTEPQGEDEGLDQMAMEATALPRESRGSLAAPTAGKEELPATATVPGEFISDTGIYIQDPMRLPRIACPQDVRKSCMVGTVVTLITVPLVLLCCYVGIRKLYEKRKYLI
ncbi:uncharacterized protein ACIQIH_012363 [Cyanocitta cristata]